MSCSRSEDASPRECLRMPDEGDPHTRTWMAFGARRNTWGRSLLSTVQGDLCRVASAIARFEPVSMLVRQKERSIVEKLLEEGADITLVECDLDDIWLRDSGPVFVTSEGDGAMQAISFNFNGWGEKQEHALDANIASFVASQAGAKLIRQPLVMEGGGIEVDGEGTAIVTESCVLNRNRNPGLSKKQAEAQLAQLLGLSRIVWLPGIAGKDITDGHTDFYARFVRPGVVVAHFDPDPESYDHKVTTSHLDILRTSTDAKGRPLEVHVLTAPNFDALRWTKMGGKVDDFAAGYVNFYLCNGAVIAPQFGDHEADSAAAQVLTGLFPHREVVTVNIDGIAAGGGGIHCTTQQECASQAGGGRCVVALS